VQRSDSRSDIKRELDTLEVVDAPLHIQLIPGSRPGIRHEQHKDSRDYCGASVPHQSFYMLSSNAPPLIRSIHVGCRYSRRIGLRCFGASTETKRASRCFQDRGTPTRPPRLGQDREEPANVNAIPRDQHRRARHHLPGKRSKETCQAAASTVKITTLKLPCSRKRGGGAAQSCQGIFQPACLFGVVLRRCKWPPSLRA
jgi:hypothetical protein